VNDHCVNNLVYKSVLQDKKNELEEISKYYDKLEKEIFEEIHKKVLDMKNKCFEKTQIQIENMKKYFSKEFFDSLSNVLATSKNYHKIKFKKFDYSKIDSKLNKYLNAKPNIENRENTLKLKKYSSLNIPCPKNKLENSNKNETSSLNINPDLIKNSTKKQPLSENIQNVNLSETLETKSENKISLKKFKSEKLELDNNFSKTSKNKQLKNNGFKSSKVHSLSVQANPHFECYQTEVLLDLKSIRKQKLENFENNSHNNNHTNCNTVNNTNINDELIIEK